MPARRFLAFDLGAESGRAVVGTLERDRLSTEEIHRFPNEPVEVGNTLYWDVLALYGHVLKGMRACAGRFGESVDGIGVDTWGVDFGLIGPDGALLENPVHYRDRRTEGMVEAATRRIPSEHLFRLTGVDPLPIRTLYQLLACRLRRSAVLELAETFLMMPDLIAYFLTGERLGERTNAVTTQLCDPRAGQWSEEVFRRLDLPLSIMPKLVSPGTTVGPLRESVARSVGLGQATVFAPCTHDTASAVAAVPGEGDDWAFLSSGTWSVLGALTDEIVTSPQVIAAGVCNELTVGSPFLACNIMGLWLLQRARAEWEAQGQEYSYADLVELAGTAPPNGPLIASDAACFLSPEDMVGAIRAFCARTGQRQPESPGEVTRCILESLALAYRQRLDQLGGLLGRTFSALHVVGGGSRNSLLCQLTADATGIPVLAGPSEATVAGNCLVQALATGLLSSPGEIRDVVRASAELVTYGPRDAATWADRYGEYLDTVQQGAR